MRPKNLALVSMLATVLSACSPLEIAEPAPNGLDMAPAADQQPGQPSCPAAAGIAGDVLFCADFSKIHTLSDPALGNWNFHVAAKDCWQIVDNILSNKDVKNLDYYCAMSLPALDLTEPTFDKYNRTIFSINYSLNLKNNQLVDMYLTTNDLSLNSDGYLFDQGGSDEEPYKLSRNNTFSIENSQMPKFLNKVYKPYIRLISRYKDIDSQGWQISSVAIIGAP